MYLVFTGFCIWSGFSETGNWTNNWGFILPFMPQIAFLSSIGLGSALPDNLSDWAGAALIGVPTLILLYGIGWALEKLLRSVVKGGA
jgi:hydrogenase/urease accessory protein HupE